MQAGRNTQLERDLGQIFGPGVGPREDRALLADFAADRDAAAFEALVVRHGPMVRGVCRRVLGDTHDADDAFQATFLVLILKGGRIRDADRLAPWLYGVATRVAAKARTQAARRRGRHEGAVDALWAPAPDRDQSDVLPLIDAEVAQLPPKLRDVLVLCLLEGLTVAEVARRLGCPHGTVKSRLARGRDALRARLIGRGVAPSVALAIPSSLAPAPVAAALLRSTVALATAARFAPSLLSLTQGVAPTMITKSTAVASLLLGGILLVGGTLMTTGREPPGVVQEPATKPSPAASRPQPSPQQESMDHVKTLMLAFQNYLSRNNHFPPAAIYGSDGEPKLSWRVALLPYLDATPLYNEFHLDEPWHSPHNRPLLARMPDVFRTPDTPVDDGLTRFRGFRGDGAMFDGVRGVEAQQVTDGTSNTLLIVAAAEPVAWTRPEGLSFVPGQPLPALFDDGSESFAALVGMADGSANRIDPANEALLRKAITRNGGEPIAWSIKILEPGSVRVATDTLATSTASPPSLTSPTVEQRLQRLEEKLDRLIDKLDAQAGAAGKVKP